MGTKVRKDGRTLEGVDLYMGGTVGKDAHLGTCVRKGIPCEDLKPILRDILVEQFGAHLTAEMPVGQPSQIEVTVEDELPTSLQFLQQSQSSAPAIAAPATVQFAKSGQSVTSIEGGSILEMAEHAGIDLDSSCRSGTCGTCRQTLLAGEVRYDGDPAALDDDDRAARTILTCIAHPVGQVSIEA